MAKEEAHPCNFTTTTTTREEAQNIFFRHDNYDDLVNRQTHVTGTVYQLLTQLYCHTHGIYRVVVKLFPMFFPMIFPMIFPMTFLEDGKKEGR
jgi:hypothetical protein